MPHLAPKLARSAVAALLATGTIGANLGDAAPIGDAPRSAPRSTTRSAPRSASHHPPRLVAARRADDPVITPDGGALNAPENTSGLGAPFQVYNPNPVATTFYFFCAGGGVITGCTDPAPITLAAGATTTVTLIYSTGSNTSSGNGGYGQLYLYGFDGSGGTEQAWYDITLAGARISPRLDPTPHSGDRLSVGSCVAGCFDAVVSYATPPYISMDAPWSATLVYRSSQAAPRGFVQVDATDNSTDPATRMSIRLLRPDGTWVTFMGGSQEVHYAKGTGANRLAVQFDAVNMPTGVYSYTLVVRNWWADGSMRETSMPVRAIVVNETGSFFGWGWSLVGLQRLYRQADGALLITEGDGSAVRFGFTCATCTYASPAGEFSQVTPVGTVGADGIKYRRRYPDGTTYSFHTDGRLLRVEDRFGNRTTYNWDSQARLQWIGDPGGNSLWFGYGANARLSSINDTGGLRVTWFTVDANLNLTEIMDPLGGYSLRATYDASHRMRTRTDRRGSVSGFAYDFAGKLAADTLPTISADGVNVRPVSKGRSLETTVLIDPASGKGTAAAPGTRVIPANVRATVTNARANVTSYALDRSGAPTRIEAPLGRTTVFERNPHSQVTRSISPSGDTVDYAWNAEKLIEMYQRSTGQRVTMEYEFTYGQLTRKSDGVTQMWQSWSGGKMDYRDVGRAPGQNRTTFTYENWNGRITGRLASQRDPSGHVTSYTYATGTGRNLATLTTSGTRVWTYGTDTYGRRSSVRDPSGRLTTTTYDDLGRVLQTVGELGDTTTFEYDALYRTSMTDAKGQTYRFAPNALGWGASYTDPAGRAITFTYDVVGNIKRRVDRRGRTVTFTHDALDQLATRVADGVTTTYKSDPKALFTLASNSESVDTIKFDRAGRPIAEIAVRNKVRYERKSTYNPQGKRTRLEVVSPWVASMGFAYDTLMRLDTLVDLAGGRTKLTYNADWQLTGILLPTNPWTSTSMTYPATHANGSVMYTAADGSQAGATYAYDWDVRIQRRIDRAVTTQPTEEQGRRYGYDNGHRVTGYEDYLSTGMQYICNGNGTEIIDPTTGESCWTQPSDQVLRSSAYAYDIVGNRSDSGSVVLPGNRLARFKGDTLIYDADGNLVKRRNLSTGSTDSLVWNSLGQLTAFRRNGVTVASFFYNGFGQRVRKVAGTTTTRYLQDGDDLLAETDANGKRLAEYTYYPGIDKPHSVRRWSGTTSAVSYFITDVPGNVIALVNQSGAITARYGYSPFGTLQDSSGATAANQIRFAARELDKETGLYFVRARYYDPTLGRFISEDPIGLEGGINLYTYAGNNPVNALDPTGMFKIRISWRSIGWVVAFVAITIASGGNPLPAFAALGAAAGGAALSAAVETAIAGDGQFWGRFRRNFDYASWWMAINVIVVAPLSGGFAGAGANGPFQGYVATKGKPFGISWLEGALTLGSGTVYGGVPVADYAAHEFGHTIQMALLSSFGKNPWLPYIGLGVAGMAGQWSKRLGIEGLLPDIGCLWENLASALGGSGMSCPAPAGG
jgi:RHS repeat-associated protein